MRLLIGIAIALLLVFALAFLAAESVGWLSAASVTGWMEWARASAAGQMAAAGLVVALLAADLVLPVPSSVVMTLSGGFLGCAGGTAASFAGAMASALLGFGLCRRLGQRAFERIIGSRDVGRIEQFFERYGLWGILLSRSVPMLTEMVSCVAGLSRLPFRTFAAVSTAGTLPICIVYAWAGSRGVSGGPGWAILLAFVIPATGFLAVRIIEGMRSPRR